MKTRMQPIGNAWQKLPRVCATSPVNSTSRSSSKCTAPRPSSTVRCSTSSRTRSPYGAQLGRHGLETTAERRALGKPEKGTIRLSAYHEGGHIIIGISDDGRGLNTEKIKAKALANGPPPRPSLRR